MYRFDLCFINVITSCLSVLFKMCCTPINYINSNIKIGSDFTATLSTKNRFDGEKSLSSGALQDLS